MMRVRTVVLALALVAACASGADAAGAKGKGKQKDAPKPPPPSDLIIGSAQVVDGSNLVVGGAKVHLFGVEAPPLDRACTRGGKPWACGRDAAAALAQVINGHNLRCKIESVDYAGRAISTCRTSEGVDINQASVAGGWAAANVRQSRRYVTDETAAKSAHRGLWAADQAKSGAGS